MQTWPVLSGQASSSGGGGVGGVLFRLPPTTTRDLAPGFPAGMFAEQMLSPGDTNTQFYIFLSQADAPAPRRKRPGAAAAPRHMSSEMRVLTDGVWPARFRKHTG